MSENIPTKQWYEQSQNFSLLLKWGQQLVGKHPNAHIVCLGQSPAWIVKAAETLSSSESKACRFDYIPFSGRTHKLSGKSAYQRDTKRSQPNDHQLSCYRDFLSSHSLSPQHIIEKNRKGIPTLLVEYTEYGRGLASFLSVLMDWAAESGQEKELAQSLTILNYSYSRVNHEKIDGIKVDDHPNIQMIRQQINDQLIFALRMNDDPESSTQRFVPSYPSNAWSDPPDYASLNTTAITAINNILSAEAKTFVNFQKAVYLG